MWGVKQNIMSRYRKLLKTSSDCQDGCCGKGSCLFFERMSENVVKVMSGLGQLIFFLVVYVGISRKMERWLMWKYLKHIFVYSLYNDERRWWRRQKQSLVRV